MSIFTFLLDDSIHNEFSILQDIDQPKIPDPKQFKITITEQLVSGYIIHKGNKKKQEDNENTMVDGTGDIL